MDRTGPQRDPTDNEGTTDRGAERRPEGICTPTYREVALKLLDQGYEPVPVTPRTKRVPATAWTTIRIDEAQVEDWCQRFGHCGVGLRTGHLVAIDIDLLDPELAHQAAEIVTARLGPTILRVGRWPKRLMLYRTTRPMPKRQVGKVEVLGLGQQFVAFGIHQDTGLPYDWPTGDSPLDLPLDALPEVDEAMIEAVLAELQPIAGPAPSGSRKTSGGGGGGGTVLRDADGRVTDGRDGHLSAIAFHALHDALDRGQEPDEPSLADLVWTRFAQSTHLSRPKQDGRQAYGPHDALRKVRDKIRLWRDGHLPKRKLAMVEPDHVPPELEATSARQELDRTLADAMEAVAAWHRGDKAEAAPRLGIRATVGLGKSTAARRHVAELVATLGREGRPNRVLNLVPSLALADETAEAWAEIGIPAVVLRGYEALDPFGEPMCRDVAAVRGAVDAGIDIQGAACFRSQSQRCPHFVNCLKQKNRDAVAAAQVVVAAYDAMFTGFAGDTEGFALLLIDEGCWQRSLEKVDSLTIEALPYLGIDAVAASRRQDARGAATADVIAARQRLAGALFTLLPGEVTAAGLREQGIDADSCVAARDAEYQALPPPSLVPGQGAAARRAALENSRRRAIAHEVIALWSMLTALLRDEPRARAKIWLGVPSGKDGQRAIHLWRRKVMADDLAPLPLLHLDATLRPELATVGLPGLEVTTVEAAAPHQHVRLIAGSFGKGAICPDGRAAPGEQERRTNRLQEVVDHVRWHAGRHPGQRVLVITYKDIEDAFAGIPGVETAHYNAIAGLDGWGNIAALFLIGRPLPSSQDLAELTGAVFDHSTAGDYAQVRAGLHLPGGRTASVKVIRHEDAMAEVLRAAICDDEVMQALGRARGINRTAGNPVEVHILADVVLPISHDRVSAWEMVCPDIVQRMLLAGLAVDSPAHAAKLHPGLFGTAVAAEHAFRRAGFNRQNPIRDIHREKAVKSAKYRLGGRGQGWQRAYWNAGSSLDALGRLERAIGPVEDWRPA